MSELRVTSGKGLHLTFNNGWTLSIQIGGGNYCSNYDQPIFKSDQALPASYDAEIAAWHASNKSNRDDRMGGMIQWPDGDTVQGYVHVDTILDMVEGLRKAKGFEDGVEVLHSFAKKEEAR